MEWEVSQWGSWKICAYNEGYEVELEAWTDEKGCVLRAPVKDAGFVPMCNDTFYGNLKVEVWERTRRGGRGKASTFFFFFELNRS